MTSARPTVATFLAAVASWPASRSWLRAGSPTTPSARSGPAGSTPVPAPPRSPSWSPPARARRTRSGRGRPTSVQRRSGLSTTPWGTAGLTLSVPRWGQQPRPCGAAVREPGSKPAQRPDRAVVADLQLLPPVGLGGAGRLASRCACCFQHTVQTPACSPCTLPTAAGGTAATVTCAMNNTELRFNLTMHLHVNDSAGDIVQYTF